MWVRLGNCRTSALIETHDRLWPRIDQALLSEERVVEIRQSGRVLRVPTSSATAMGCFLLRKRRAEALLQPRQQTEGSTLAGPCHFSAEHVILWV
jgi:tRNA A37 threonylcarbamoyladenosine synthetase subunit TsaC/SUA5/YrdC